MKRRAAAALLGCLAYLVGASPAPAQGVLDASCPGPGNFNFTVPGNDRVAQTFAAQTTGSLVRGEIEIFKGGSPGGNYVMQILATDAIGNPTNSVLASTTIVDASVPNGATRLLGVFTSPAAVGAGQQYALALTRPGADQLTPRGRSGNPCPGASFRSVGPSGTWGILDSSFDNVFAVYVKPSNAFTLGTTALNKKKGTATLNLTLPNPGELTGSGKGAKVASARAVTSKSVAAGPATLLIKAKGKKRKKLNENGKVKLKVAITYTPTGGDPAMQSVKVKLKKKL